ncbi:hypothetical protein D1007_55758 [Hordeum vulgare]|nr:hypothetical protein D1007_55758 [Hordeum vulgare]
MPPAKFVSARVPAAENSQAPQAGEVVVFTENFSRRFGLPARNFFSTFLTQFGVQPHHLAANVVLQLAAYVTLCKGFLGTELRVDLWRRLFYFKQGMMKGDAADNVWLTAYNAALIVHWTSSSFPGLPLQNSVKKWQRVFFYVKNVNPTNDRINMPPFVDTPSLEKLNSKMDLTHPAVEVKLLSARLEILEAEGLTSIDLLATMVAHRILPLQRLPHLICQMGGRHNPCGLSMKVLRASSMAARVNLISSASMDEGDEWEWGKAAYDRANPALMVYGQPANDVDMSDPEEIEEVDEPPSRSRRNRNMPPVCQVDGREHASGGRDRGSVDAHSGSIRSRRQFWCLADENPGRGAPGAPVGGVPALIAGLA